MKTLQRITGWFSERREKRLVARAARRERIRRAENLLCVTCGMRLETEAELESGFCDRCTKP